MRQFTRNFHVIFITCVHFHVFCTFEDEKMPLLNIFLFKTAEKAVFLIPVSPLFILITSQRSATRFFVIASYRIIWISELTPKASI